MRRDVAQHHPDPSAAEPAEGVEVAADRIRRQASRRHLGVAVQHRGRGEQLELEIVRQLQLPAEPLLPRVALDQPGVLHRGADLVGHRGDQLAVARREAVAADPVGEIDDADAAERRAGRAIADGHAQEGLPPVPAVAGAVARDVGHLLGIVDDDRAARGTPWPRPSMSSSTGHRREAVDAEALAPPRCGAARIASSYTMIDARRAPTTRAHLAHDGPGRLLQPHRLAQDLADGVEEVDLLVAAASSSANEAALPLGLEQGRDDRRETVEAAVARAVLGSRVDLEPEALAPCAPAPARRSPPGVGTGPAVRRNRSGVQPGSPPRHHAQRAAVEAPQAHPSAARVRRDPRAPGPAVLVAAQDHADGVPLLVELDARPRACG